MTERKTIKIPAALLEMAKTAATVTPPPGFQEVAKLVASPGFQEQAKLMRTLAEGLPKIEIVEDTPTPPKSAPVPPDSQQIAHLVKEELRSQARRKTARDAVKAATTTNQPPPWEIYDPIDPQPAQHENSKSENAYLLKAPIRVDDWFRAIDAMAKEFFRDHKRLPSDIEAWAKLCKHPPNGYGIEKIVKGKAECLTMFGVKAIDRGAFKRRWKKYADNK